MTSRPSFCTAIIEVQMNFVTLFDKKYLSFVLTVVTQLLTFCVTKQKNVNVTKMLYSRGTTVFFKYCTVHLFYSITS